MPKNLQSKLAKKQKEILKFISNKMLGECSSIDFYEEFFTSRQEELAPEEMEKLNAMLAEAEQSTAPIFSNEDWTKFAESAENAKKLINRQNSPQLEYDVQLQFLIDRKFVEETYKGDYLYYRITHEGENQLKPLFIFWNNFIKYIVPILSVIATILSIITAIKVFLF